MTDRERLIQEEYVDTEHGPWKVLVVCQMLNKTTWMQAENVVKELFDRWPSPEKMAFMSLDEIKELWELLRPLGLVKSRVKNVLKMSIQYCEERDMFGENFAKYSASFAGCGQYAKDAWTLFVLKRPCSPADRRLKIYAKENDLWVDNLNEEEGL